MKSMVDFLTSVGFRLNSNMFCCSKITQSVMLLHCCVFCYYIQIQSQAVSTGISSGASGGGGGGKCQFILYFTS